MITKLQGVQDGRSYSSLQEQYNIGRKLNYPIRFSMEHLIPQSA